MNKRATGAEYEKLASDFLKQQGYQILVHNYRCRSGEIDMIAKDGAYLVFVEVKYRSNTKTGEPLEAVDVRKQRVISKVAAYYCYSHGYGETTPCRFDVVSICGEEYRLIQNAFEYAGW